MEGRSLFMIELMGRLRGGRIERCSAHSASPLLEPHPADVSAHAG